MLHSLQLRLGAPPLQAGDALRSPCAGGGAERLESRPQAELGVAHPKASGGGIHPHVL